MSDAQRHEPIDPPMRPVVAGALIALVACVGGGLFSLGLLQQGRQHVRLMPDDRTWYQSYPTEVSEVEAAPFTVPTDAEREADAAKHRLESYGWVDRDLQIVHVPLDVAIDAYLDGRDAGAP